MDMAEETLTTDDCGHLRTSSLDEIQAEDRQSREAADIRITFLEAMAGEKLPQWQRDIAKLLLDGPPYQMIVHRRLGRITRPTPPP
jgi:hypothetical protein